MRSPESGILGDEPDVGKGKPHIKIERRGQCRRHRVPELVEEDERHDEQCLPDAGARDELVKRLDHRFGQCARRRARQRGLAHQQRVGDAGHHEQRGDREDGIPGKMIGQHQRQRAGHEAGNAVGLHVDRVAQTELRIGQELAPIRVENDVLRRGEECDRSSEIRDRPQVELRPQRAEERYRHEQQQLSDEHPAAAPTEERQRIAVDQRRPYELPGERQLNQREQPD